MCFQKVPTCNLRVQKRLWRNKKSPQKKRKSGPQKRKNEIIKKYENNTKKTSTFSFLTLKAKPKKMIVYF